MKNRNKKILSVAMLAVLMSCAHSLKPVKISSTSNVAEEITSQSALVEAAYTAQVDVLAPDNFQEAKDYLLEAKRENKKGASNKDVLESLGYSKSYLEQATKEAQAANASIAEITSAREKALAAGARDHKAELTAIDEKLKNWTDSDKVSIPAKDKISLQNDYIALELLSIKSNYLSAVRKTLKHAEEKNAADITPKAYNLAMAKYNIADKLIETDRHSAPLIIAAVAEATLNADRVMRLLQSEKSSRGQNAEQRAVALENKDIATANSVAATNVAVAESAEKSQELAVKSEAMAEQAQVLAVSEDENKDLRKKEMDDMVVKQAAAQFTKNEADVYRQDGLLIIRLKNMNFASGRSELPTESLAILSKVRDVIKGFGAGMVTVEGHTDGVGAARTNQKLSENRAASVVKYFETEGVSENNKLSYVGYGYSKPLGSNKTSIGRAQNRRVDVLIRPNQAI